MAALRDIARDFAAEIRDGIGWTIVYRTGRSWNALTIWSDIWNGEWETNDLNDAIGILKADPDAVIVNGYYCGHFGEDMTIDEIADGIRWHYEGGRNRLADYCEVTQGRDALEEGRKAAEAAGLPFCERLADGGDDELSPYVYDGSMTLADREKMQQAREAFEKLADALQEIAAKLAEALKPVINAVLSALKKLWKVSAKAIGVPPKWLHLAAHAKKARTRKKYRNRIRRYADALRLLCQPERSAGAGCTYSLMYYEKQGRYHAKDPKPGDQIFFSTAHSKSNVSHTGLVEKVDGSKVYTIEGNTSDRVARRSYYLSDSYIVGYGRPAYDAEPGNTNTGSQTPSSGTTSEVTYTVVAGDTLSKIAAKYGTTYQKLAAYNGITNPNIIRVGQKIKIPGAPAPKKTNAEIAKEVIAGKWGNGADRKKRLEAAGYDYNAIQQAVNAALAR